MVADRDESKKCTYLQCHWVRQLAQLAPALVSHLRELVLALQPRSTGRRPGVSC